MEENKQDDDIGIIDVENYQGNKEKTYNSQQLVMEQLSLCLKNGSVEMIEGWWDEKVNKNGEYTKIYHPDSRRTFIESVKSLMMFVHRDYKDDPKANKRIEDKKIEIKLRKKYWLNEELRWWHSLNPAQRQQKANEGKAVNQGMFNKKNDFDNFYFDEELQLYRDIFEIIADFIKDTMHDYEEIIYTG